MHAHRKWKLILLLIIHVVQCRYHDAHRPCIFNPLCTCSNAGPDLGSVNCINVPFTTIPAQIKHSAIYMLKLQSNELRVMENNSLIRTGLWKLQINDNLLTNLPSKALSGLEKTLSILDLSDNSLVRIPKEALSRLEKLQILSLARNRINTVHTDDIFQLGKTLKDMDLSGNSLSHIHNDAFRDMESLENLNLATNSIVSINDVMLNNRFYNLKYINLMENQLRLVPLTALANLKRIKSINLSKNIITSLSDELIMQKTTVLEELNLEYNLLQELPPSSFKHYLGIDRIYLNGNPLKSIKSAAFFGTNAAEIYLSDCLLSEITSDSFKGVEHSIQTLDLSYNNLTVFPELTFARMQKLNLKGNKITDADMILLKGIGTTLKHMDASGMKMGYFPISLIMHMPNIRYLSMNKHNSKISEEDFLGVTLTMEELHLTGNLVQTIEKGAFSSLSALKTLDISYNSIKTIDNDAFRDIAHTLEKLVMHKALSMKEFPQHVFKHLSKLMYLDASSNYLTLLPHDSLDFLGNIQYLNLNHNSITEITGRHINKRNNPEIKSIKLAFNKIIAISPYSFNGMKNLLNIKLHDNIIKSIKKSTFVDLDSAVIIDLEGNNIENIEDDAFQNLPGIQHINLAHNHLKTFNMDALDQVGRLSTLKINVNHNKMQELLKSNDRSSHTSSNIKIMTFNYNNISHLDAEYFDPVRNSIIILDLSVNHITNLTNGALSNMGHLQVLTVARNQISQISDDSFDGLRNLQILNISHNNISELSENTFEDQKTLRIFDASNNNIQLLPDKIFQPTILEQLNLAYNEIEVFPAENLVYVNETLQYLDLSGNCIQAINETCIIYLENLKELILSDNGLFSFDDQMLLLFPKLVCLDLSHNDIGDSNSMSKLPHTIENLNLADTNLTSFPSLEATSLTSLNLSHNFIEFIPQDMLLNLSNIQDLDLSSNELKDIHKNIWSNLHQLRSLTISDNQIRNLLNNSFVNLKKLQKLDIHKMKFDDISPNALGPLVSLKLLEIDTNPSVKGYNISELLQENYGIKELHLHLKEERADEIFRGKMPKSLNVITLEGNQLEELSEHALQGLNSKNLILNIHSTNISRLTSKFFKNLKDIQNLTAVFKNNELRVIGDIPFYPEEEANKKLERLELQENQLICDCSLEWVWDWIKEYEYMNECYENPFYHEVLSSMRETKCYNKNNSSIIDVFKTELQCFSNAWTMTTKELYFILPIIELLVMTYTKTAI